MYNTLGMDMCVQYYSTWFVCVSTLICHLTHLNHKRDILTDSSQYVNDKKKPIFVKLFVQKLRRNLLTSSSSGILPLYFFTK